MHVTGTPDSARKFRVICLSKMKQEWDTHIGKGFPFKDLAKSRFVSNGGHLDRSGCVPYDEYIQLLGDHFPFLCFSVLRSHLIHPCSCQI